MQTHMPIGYVMVNGKIQIDKEKFKIVKKIYSEYLKGKSLVAIAKALSEKEVPNANNKTNWTHSAVGRILENNKYKGDEFYPELIDKATFDEVQVKRKQKEKQLGRTAQPNSMKNQNLFSNKIYCGECGEPYRKYTEHSGKASEKSRWKCKKYIFKNRVLCRNLFYTDEELKLVFKSAVNQLIKNQRLLDMPRKKETPKISKERREIENQIHQFEEDEDFSSKELAVLIFKRAELTYSTSKIDDYEVQTQKIKEMLIGKDLLTEFHEELFKEMIDKITIYQDGKVETQFINGLIISEILEYKRKDEKNGYTKKNSGNHTASNEI
ncbi:recombinase family protein [Anaerotignum propionicum]|uniref:recombinase family protein n=1 Tax=Anaerotignum propionicum TaxID=28446 RepID=UPI00210CAAB8|nr:recombinase family protein [Anaerotignum propionicum]MCQ4936045.1 recombinase family protein [Anaerotignum propionicum]